MVVEARAVKTELAFSSALATIARLATAVAVKPTVHLFNFIGSSDVIDFSVWFYCYFGRQADCPVRVFIQFLDRREACPACIKERVKPLYPRTKTGFISAIHRQIR